LQLLVSIKAVNKNTGMNWYILSKTTNFKVAGTDVPQTEALATDKPFPLAVYNKYLRSPAPKNLFIPKFKLRYRAKLTDLTSVGFLSFPTQPIISEKFFHALKGFKSPEFQAFPTKVIDKKGVEHPYYVLMQNSPQFGIVDYGRSRFSRIAEIRDGYKYVFEDFQASDFEDVLNQKGVDARALYIQDDIGWDFFILAGPPFLWMVNEPVAQALQSSKITGICLVPFQQGEDFIDERLFNKAQRVEGTK
jgi:hypothetical protein